MALKRLLRALKGAPKPEYEMQSVQAYTIKLPPEKGGGSVHVAAISCDAYRIVISGGVHPSSFAVSKHDAGALVAILRKLEG